MPIFHPIHNGYTSATTSTVTSTVFSGWVNATATATTTTIWNNWITVYHEGGTTTGTATWYEAQEAPERTPEEVAAQEARFAARREQARVEALARRRAGRRALATLLRFITASQRDELRAHGHFHVSGGATGSRYRIRRGRVANIDVLDASGKIVRRLCAHPALDVPDSDTMLAQALHLQSAANEEVFVRTANIHPVR
jgi:hypothetical protein